MKIVITMNHFEAIAHYETEAIKLFWFVSSVCFLYRIANRRDAVVSRRQKVKALSADRAAKLLASLAWQQFNRNADEVSMNA